MKIDGFSGPFKFEILKGILGKAGKRVAWEKD
jgi:hypothetical protein